MVLRRRLAESPPPTTVACPNFEGSKRSGRPDSNGERALLEPRAILGDDLALAAMGLQVALGELFAFIDVLLYMADFVSGSQSNLITFGLSSVP